ncbi:MAG: hypothetical protein BIFFINMI_00191 [Phycisphaerae bacterium]|nr:hypothetical protein [Phycisphaerae bacterium]
MHVMVKPTDNDAPPAAGSADLLFGVAGWSYKDWEGMVYPAGADGATKMLSVAAACDLLEVNTTFYSTPAPGVTAAWARRLDRAGLGNRLVIKLCRVFSHDPDYSAADVKAAREALAPLDDSAVVDANGVEQPRLLALLLQFPHFFRLTPENTQRIERLAEDFADWDKVIELRHKSWARPVAYSWLRRLGFSLANIDLPAGSPRPGRFGDAGPSAAPAPDGEARSDANAFPPEVVATGPVGYLRLHGRNDQAWFDRKAPVHEKYNYLYRDEELADLAGRIRTLADRTKRVAVVGNNHYRGKALVTVLQLAHLLTNRRVKLPAPMLAAYPQVQSFAEPAEPFPATSADGKSKPRPAGRKPKASPRRPKKSGDDPQMTLFD